jgi:centractin
MSQPVVIDNGTGMLKAGFAGADKPRVVFRSCVGRAKHQRIIPGGALEGGDLFVGSKVEEHRGALLLSYPMEHGVVQNWQEMEKMWSHVSARENLNVRSEEHAVLLTEAPLNPLANQEKAAELFFEAMNVPALFFSLQAILSLYASGRTTGVVLDSGDGVTHAVPVYEGFAMPHAITRMDLAGRDVTQHLQLLLRRGGHNFTTSAELEVVRQIKEQCCIVAFNPAEQEKQQANAQLAAKYQYSLPDGSTIEVGAEAFRAPEILFRPDLVGSEYRGVHDCLVKSVMKTDLDLRRVLFSQMVLSGGSTLFPGFGDRLLNEVRKHPLAPRDTKIRIAAPPERIYSTWIGGSILASLSTFKSLWITKADWAEQGSRILVSGASGKL